MYEPNLRKNGQVVQPNVEFTPDNNGWPTPLKDESSPVRQQVTVGKNGESIMNDGINTSQSKNGGWHLPEGSSQASATQGNTQADGGSSSGDPLKTTQQKNGAHSVPEGK